MGPVIDMDFWTYMIHNAHSLCGLKQLGLRFELGLGLGLYKSGLGLGLGLGWSNRQAAGLRVAAVQGYHWCYTGWSFPQTYACKAGLSGARFNERGRDLVLG